MEEMKKDNMQEKSSGWKKWVAIATVAVASFFGVNVQDAEAGSAYNKVTRPHKIHQKVTVPNIVDSKKIVDMKFGKNKVVVTKKVYKAPKNTLKTAQKKLIRNVKNMKLIEKVIKSQIFESSVKAPRSDRDKFHDRIRVHQPEMKKIIIRTQEEYLRNKPKIAKTVNNPYLSSPENERLTVLKQRHLDLRAQLREAKEHNDRDSQELINMALKHISEEESKIYNEIRTRKAAQQGRDEGR